MATVIVKCKECGTYAERGIGGSGAEFCGLNCKARDFRRRHKAERDAFRAELRTAFDSGRWETASHLIATDPRAAELTHAELSRLAETIALNLGRDDAIFVPGIGWFEPSNEARARLCELAG